MKTYNVVALTLHNARRVLGLPVIAHTGKVNSYARCMGGKLKSASSVADARRIMTANVAACGGTPSRGAKKAKAAA